MAFTPLVDPTQNKKRRARALDITQLADATKKAQRGGTDGKTQSLPSSSTKPPARPHPPPNRPSPSTSQASSATTSVKPEASSQASTTSAPDAKQGEYTEFMIFSSDPSDKKFSILTFKPPNSNTVISFPEQFQQPIKLNRKQPKSMLYAPPPNFSTEAFVPVKPMLGPDGKPVYGPDGKIIMVNAEGHTAATVAKLAAKQNAKGKGKAANGAAEGTPGGAAAKKKANNRPKTKQTFKASDETRLKRKEEYHPWVLEDSAGGQEWIGRMDAKNDDGVWALFMVDSNSGKFQFRPVHRFYNFVDRRQYVASQRADDVNEAIAKKKTINIVSEFTRRGGGSQATVAFAQRAERDRVAANIKPKTEQSGDLFGDDDDHKADMGAEGDLDEMEWEEEMADDEEDHQHEEMEADEEEQRTKERQKQEYKTANKLRDAHVDESDDDEDFLDLLSGEGKRMKNSLKKMNKEYDDESEDEDDPYGKRYGSDVKEEEQEPELLVGVRKQSVPPPPPPSANPPNPTINLPPKPKVAPPGPVQPTGPIVPPPRASSIKPGSRATSPVPGAGQALIAMRATSPHRPIGRTSSPLAPKPGSRATSPSHGTPARAASPATSAAQNLSTTNSGANTPRVLDKKRKSPFEEAPLSVTSTPSNPITNGNTSGEAKPKKKIHKTDVPEPTTEVLISFLKTMPNYTATSGQVSDRFGGKKWKAKLLELLKPIIDLGHGENGVRTVTLKPELR